MKFIWEIRAQICLSLIHGLILVTFVLFLLGHILHHPPPNLNPFNNYISQYAVSATSRGYIQWTIISTSAIVFSISFALLRRFQSSHLVQINCLIMIIAATCLFFVAIYPTKPVAMQVQAKPGFHPLDKLWELLHPVPVDKSVEAISSVHDQMISNAMHCLCFSMALLGIYFVKTPEWRKLGWWSLSMMILSTALLLKGVQIMPSLAGLWQRTGFLVVFVWMWLIVARLKRTAVAAEASISDVVA